MPQKISAQCRSQDGRLLITTDSVGGTLCMNNKAHIELKCHLVGCIRRDKSLRVHGTKSDYALVSTVTILSNSAESTDEDSARMRTLRIVALVFQIRWSESWIFKYPLQPYSLQLAITLYLGLCVVQKIKIPYNTWRGNPLRVYGIQCIN